MDELDKIPPQNTDMERAVLGAMIIDDEAINKAMMQITEETFYKPTHQAIFRAIKLLWEEETPVDQLTLAEKLNDLELLEKIGGEATIAGLMNEVGSTANIEYHCDELLEKESLRRIVTLCTTAANYAYKGTHESKMLLHHLSNKFDQIIDKTKTKKAHPMVDVIQEGYKLISERIESKEGLVGLPTGYPVLDKITGGWQKGDMIIIAARPSMGKTSLALEIAVRVAKKEHPVGIISIETTYRKLGMRMISTKARQNVGDLYNEENKIVATTKLSNAANYLSKLPIWIDDDASATVSEIRAHTKRMQKLYGIKLLIIDYLQIISGNDNETKYKQITDISKGIKGLGKSLDIPVIILSQLRRPQAGKEHIPPVLSEMRDAGGLEENADIVIFIHNPTDDWKREYLNKHGINFQDDDLSTKRQLRVAKNRDGIKAVMLFNWQGAYYSFEEISTQNIEALDE